MRVLVFFITRFSVLLPLQDRTYEWATTQGTFEEHKQHLFDDHRLSIRMRTFESLTVPSIREQEIPENSNVKVIHLVLTSTELPPAFMDRLERLAVQSNHTKIVRIAPGSYAAPSDDSPRSLDAAIRRCVREECSEINEPALFATVRIDDDDALSKTYTKTLSSHLNPHTVGYVFSMPSGFLGEIHPDHGKIMDLRYWHFPKIALGLAYFNQYDPNNGASFFDEQIFHIHNCGSHVTVDRRLPVILDSRTLGYLATVNGVNDSGDHEYMNFLPKASPAALVSSFEGIAEITERISLNDQDAVDSSDGSTPLDMRKASQHRAVYLELAHETRHYRQLLRWFRRLREIGARLGRFNKTTRRRHT